MTAPKADTPEYRWWAQGARDELDAHNEGLSKEQLEVRDVLEGLARLNPARPVPDLVMGVALVYAAGLPLWRRLAYAWRLIAR